jgi:hypothetical protein
MGKAKKRKKLDSIWVKPKKLEVTITKSKMTRNWLINYGQFCFDSCLKYEDALVVANEVKAIAEEDPLHPKSTYPKFKAWYQKHKHKTTWFDCDVVMVPPEGDESYVIPVSQVKTSKKKHDQREYN